MKKFGTRLVAGVVALGLFAAVGTLTVSAFSTGSTGTVNAPAAAGSAQGEAVTMNNWHEVARGSSVIP